MDTMEQNNIEILIDGSDGIYLPLNFARMYMSTAAKQLKLSGMKAQQIYEDAQILLSGPDHDQYWDAWSTVLDNLIIEQPDGSLWALHQDQDLFAYRTSAIDSPEVQEILNS